ncbi:MAG TPA: universal stress protein [Solirubrobacteraceae bacterium]|nr:universal stress protein [Solirubrobacteraceae bacterium]
MDPTRPPIGCPCVAKTQPSRSTSRKEKHSQSEEAEAGPATASVFSDILCAVDGTRASEAGVRMAASLAGPTGHLTLLAVTAAAGEEPHAVAVISPSRAKQVLERTERIARAAGVPASTVVDPGAPPVDVILERSSDHDLLAIGAPASSRLGGMIIGSLSASLGGTLIGGVAAVALSRFTVPMLVVRHTAPSSLQGARILLATDGEEDSDLLVELTGRLAQSQGASVTLVHALEGEAEGSPRHVQAQVRALRDLVPVTGEPRIEPGKVWDVIVKAIEAEQPALIAMGSRRLSGLRALGSVSRRAVHDAPCSVLVVPPR